ncbi:hypothetical protein MLD38_026311 [Melastoma candidum]|uniref:Uncharacterized protein n=1 Tax=Melastoma candidum TaxID=119954 RepID=A0ACB9NZ36_9MYRT|nr:hypothetical protein MLD38_026311 [Melastoma candidum]
MSCFPCFSIRENKAKGTTDHGRRQQRPRTQQGAAPTRHHVRQQPQQNRPRAPVEHENKKVDPAKEAGANNIKAQTFTFRELATATKNFRQECLIGEGGFGRVYKGKLDNTNQVVAVKQLDRNGLQGNREFLVEVLMLSLLHHENLVNLIGYCADGDQRLLVYEYMPQRSLEDHLLDLGPNQKPLGWFTRMNIALAAAKGLEYLHDKANPPVIYRDLKSSNILLDEDFRAKLSDFGLAKLGPTGEKTHVSSRVMGTYGYCAPEYQRTGQLTVKSDVYSFGVVLLELITGRRVIDTARPINEQNLVSWAQPIFKSQKRFSELADPLLENNYPERGLNQAVAVAAMCLNEDATTRPLISDVVTALSFLGLGQVNTDQESVPARARPSDARIIDILGDYFREDSPGEREKAVAEAMEWGSNSRRNMQSRNGSASSS